MSTSVKQIGSIGEALALASQESTVLSWTGNTDVSSDTEVEDDELDAGELPPHEISSDHGSVFSVMTEHYLDQIKDREERESARRNIEYLRDSGFLVRGTLYHGRYLIKFKTPTKRVEVMTLKSFVKSKIQTLLAKHGLGSASAK